MPDFNGDGFGDLAVGVMPAFSGGGTPPPNQLRFFPGGPHGSTGNNPRYAGALNTGSDVQAFANSLQRGGYATDPDYARKLAAVAAEVGQRIAANPFKSDSAAPIAGQDPPRMSNG